MGVTQPPVPLVPGLFPDSKAARAKLTTHLPLVLGLRMRYAIPPPLPPPPAVMACTGVTNLPLPFICYFRQDHTKNLHNASPSYV